MSTKRKCCICNENFTRLGTHIHKKHPNINDKEYYDNMRNNGWLRVYDCGNFKMRYVKENQ